MRRTSAQVEVVTYSSEVDSNISTSSEGFAEIIEWADALHAREGSNAYALVKDKKSAIFGHDGSDYLAYMRKRKDVEGVLERVMWLRQQLEVASLPQQVTLGSFGTKLEHAIGPEDGRSFWRDRARFSLENFKKKGFRTGTFQQFAIWTDGKEYARAILDYDLTPETKDEILERFCGWMNASYAYPNTSRVTLDGKDVRIFEHDLAGKVPERHSCSPPMSMTEVGSEWTCGCGIVWVLCEPDRWQASSPVGQEIEQLAEGT